MHQKNNNLHVVTHCSTMEMLFKTKCDQEFREEHSMHNAPAWIVDSIAAGCSSM